MRIISKRQVNDFIDDHSDSAAALREWYLKTSVRVWTNFHDIKDTFNSVDYVGNDLYVFNIKGNKYRLIARIFFERSLVYIRFIGTHAAYNKIQLTDL